MDIHNIKTSKCCRNCAYFIASINEYRDSACREYDIHVSPFDVCDKHIARASNCDGFEFIPEPVDGE